MIGSPEINKVIRRILSPTLKENGFDKVKTRQIFFCSTKGRLVEQE